MTEAEWLTGVDPVPMLRLLDPARTDRRLQAYLVACGRNVLPLLHCPASRRAVEVMGRYLNSEATEAERGDAAVESESAVYDFGVPEHDAFFADAGERIERLPRADLERMAGWGPTPLPASGYRLLEEVTYFASYLIAVDRVIPYPACLYGQRRFLSVPILRDVYGNPFRPATVDPAWLTPTVAAAARHVHDRRAFHDLPVLADALEDAGCDDADVLAHCRGLGPHVRGCWVVDRLLGRE